MFNLRVYGFYVNNNQKILVSEEWIMGKKYIKFPGGGLEYGEGTLDCLHREFKEELNTEIEILKHIYTTDYFQPSAFKQNDQIISVYYQVNLQNENLLTIPEQEDQFLEGKVKSSKLLFRFANFNETLLNYLSLPIDKIAYQKFIKTY